MICTVCEEGRLHLTSMGSVVAEYEINDNGAIAENPMGLKFEHIVKEYVSCDKCNAYVEVDGEENVKEVVENGLKQTNGTNE